jgi:hypothetical protein
MAMAALIVACVALALALLLVLLVLGVCALIFAGAVLDGDNHRASWLQHGLE